MSLSKSFAPNHHPTSILRGALGVLIFVLTLASSIRNSAGQDPPAVDLDNPAELDEPTGAGAEMARTLYEIELELVRRNELQKAGAKIHRRYRDDLTDDYRRVANEIRLARQQDLASKLSSLQMQQRRISLMLWQLDRLEPLLSEVDQEYHSLTRVIRDLRNKNRDLLREDDALAERLDRIAIAVEKNERERLRRRMVTEREFYDVRTWPELLPERVRTRQQRLATEKSGPIDDLRVPIQRILKLKWSNGRMILDQDHWEDLFLPESLAVTAAEVARDLESRGWKLSDNAHRSFLPEKTFYRRDSSLLLLFQNLRHAAFVSNGSPGTTTLMEGTAGGNFVTDQVQGTLSFFKGNFAFILRETVAPHRNLSMTQSPGQSVLALQGGGRRTLVYRQFPNKAELQHFADGDWAKQEGPTFAEIYAANPELIEEKVFPLLTEFGVLAPPTRFDPQVVDLVLTKLQLTDSDVVEKLNRLLEQADSRRFETRTRAMNELESEIGTYAPLIAEIQNEKELSLEVKARLKRIIDTHQQEFGGIESLITKLRLIGDERYLQSLLQRVPPEHHQSIQRRIRFIAHE